MGRDVARSHSGRASGPFGPAGRSSDLRARPRLALAGRIIAFPTTPSRTGGTIRRLPYYKGGVEGGFRGLAACRISD